MVYANSMGSRTYRALHLFWSLLFVAALYGYVRCTVLIDSRIAGLGERPLDVCVVRLPHKGWHCAAP